MRLEQLHLVRHGQSVWNAEGRVQGQTSHVPLTLLGHAQAGSAARQLAGLRRDGRAVDRSPVDAIVTSDLRRARETADVLGVVLGLVPRVEPALREQALGSLEGRLTSELVAEPSPDGVHVSEVRWGGGESIRDVHARVARFLERLCADPPGSSVALVSHGDTIRVALAVLAGLDHREVEWVAVPNGSVTSVALVGSPA